MHTSRARPDVSVLADHLEVPGLGFLPVNAYVIHAAQPVVVDTGLSLPDRDFVAALAEVTDPARVRWIWLTHPAPASAPTASAPPCPPPNWPPPATPLCRPQHPPAPGHQ